MKSNEKPFQLKPNAWLYVALSLLVSNCARERERGLLSASKGSHYSSGYDVKFLDLCLVTHIFTSKIITISFVYGLTTMTDYIFL